MKITLIMIGKTDKSFVKEGYEVYTKRLKHYTNFESVVIPDIKNTKNMSEEDQKRSEGKLILKYVNAGDALILLDEGGKSMSSVEFAKWIDKHQIGSTKNLIFVIGGPYGFSEEVYKAAQGKVSLSKMTFSHQMVRMIIAEQIYRAMTILKGEPYHHQ